jgi:E3 SUMO-protein ligase PIAS1
MEQTTTWLCPVCEKVLKHEDLIVDGYVSYQIPRASLTMLYRYFYDILHQTPDSVEDVMVESDGQWHTTDNKYGSPQWLVTHPAKLDPPPKKGPIPSPSKPAVKQTNGKEKSRPKGAEVFILDSDEDDDEGRVKRELSPSNDQSLGGTQQSLGRTNSTLAAVIDLTLDSEDEELPRPTQKRKAVDAPNEQLWKRPRAVNGNGVGSSSDGSSGSQSLSPARPRVPFNPAPRLPSFNTSAANYRRPPDSRW